MGKQKEGFGNALEDAYDGQFLKHFLNESSPRRRII